MFGSSGALHTLVLRLTNQCNLGCTYCYRAGIRNVTMGSDVLEKIISQVEDLDADNIQLIWHGGEPLLLGIKFFKAALSKLGRSKKNFIHLMQTNGLLINTEWATFFKDHNFRIGISIDGPRDINLKQRPNFGGRDYYDQLLNSIAILHREHVEFGIVSVITGDPPNVEDYLAFLIENGISSVSLNLEFKFASAISNGATNNVDKFLMGLYGSLQSSESLVSIREFLCIIGNITGRNSLDYCHHSETFCGLSHNGIDEVGNVYVCCDKAMNHEMYPWAILGNIRNAPLIEILDNPKTQRAIADLASKRAECKTGCKIGAFCQGGCVFDSLSSLTGELQGIRNHCRIRMNLTNFIAADFGVPDITAIRKSSRKAKK